jgi:hypothetical protein
VLDITDKVDYMTRQEPSHRPSGDLGSSTLSSSSSSSAGRSVSELIQDSILDPKDSLLYRESQTEQDRQAKKRQRQLER